MMSRSTALRALLILLPIVGAPLAGCSGPDIPVADAPAPPPPAPVVVADDDLSYRNAPLAADSGTPGARVTAADPGESTPVPRSFENAPPVIPHNTEGLLPITVDENTCLECHAPENAEAAEATSVPASHLYDIRRGTPLTSVNPANYNCDLCHAVQNDVDELVGNDFEPDYRHDASRSSSNLLDVLNEGNN
jgi:cytochrome c-type protein NapB